MLLNRKSALENCIVYCHIVFLLLCSVIVYCDIGPLYVGTMSDKLSFSHWIRVNALLKYEHQPIHISPPADNSHLPGTSQGSALNLICNDFLTFI